MQTSLKIFLVVIFLLTVNIFSRSEKENVFHHYAHLGNYPTAIPVKKFHLENRFYISTGGTIVLSSSYGLGQFFSFGGVLGTGSIISDQKIHYFYPQFSLKYTLFFEDAYVPAISIGYDDIGRQNLFTKNTRNDYFKSRGFYLSITKYFLFFRRPLSFTAGSNYSWIDNQTENYDIQLTKEDSRKGKNDVFSGYFASDFIISNIFSFYGIYDLALDDNLSHNPLKGYLNFGVRLHFSEITINLEFQDLLRNKTVYTNSTSQGISVRQQTRREIHITYIKKI